MQKLGMHGSAGSQTAGMHVEGIQKAGWQVVGMQVDATWQAASLSASVPMTAGGT